MPNADFLSTNLLEIRSGERLLRPTTLHLGGVCGIGLTLPQTIT